MYSLPHFAQLTHLVVLKVFFFFSLFFHLFQINIKSFNFQFSFT
jgi:hypothetical protein